MVAAKKTKVDGADAGKAQPKITAFLSNKENKAVGDETTPEKSAQAAPKKVVKSPTEKRALKEDNDRQG